MLATISRPYAKAAFEYAVETKNLAGWLAFLQLLAPLSKDRAIRKILSNPSLNQQKIATLLTADIPSLSPGIDNFMQLLAAQHRLNLLPYIAELFARYHGYAEKVLAVEVTTATQLTDAQHDNIAAALQKHFGKAVTINAHVDAALLGGVLINVGDLVIDASVKGKLKNLAKQII